MALPAQTASAQEIVACDYDGGNQAPELGRDHDVSITVTTMNGDE
jgi:hypothetical protein